MNPVLAWMQEHIDYWTRERQLAEDILRLTPSSETGTLREQQMRKMLATRIIHQLETLENEVNRGDS